MAQANDVTIPMPLSSGSTDQPNVPQEGAKPLFDMSSARPIGQPKPLFDMSSARPIGKPQPLFDMSNARPIDKPAAAPTVKSVPVATAPAPQSTMAKDQSTINSVIDVAKRYGQRLGQSLGVPTNKEELTAAGTPPSIPEAIAGPGPSGIYNQLVQSGKTLYQGAKDTYREAKEAGQNIAAGGPVLQNIAKPASTYLNATVGAVPFIGAPTVRAGEDVAAKNYAGAAGGLTGVLGQVALEGAGERHLGTDEMAFHDAKVAEAQKALDAAKKTATTNYKASIDKNIKLPKEVQKPIDTAQAALDEAKTHQAAAKQAIAERQVKRPAPEPTTAQVTAQPQAPRPAPAMRVPGTPENVKTPGQVQPETFPQQPTAKPMVIPGVKTLADNQGTVGMRRMLTEGTPEAAPSANAETAPKTETPPATMAKLGKPERGNLKTLKVGEGGKVTDTETPLDRQLREALKPGEAKAPAAEPKAPEVPEQKVRAGDRRQAAVPVAEERRIGERRNAAGIRVDEHGDPVMSPDVQGHWQGSAFGEKPAEDIGAKAREKNPEPTRAETKGEAAKPTLEKPVPATEPGLMKAGEEGREQPKSAAEYHPAVREQVTALPDEKLKQLAKAHGLNPDEYDFKVRDEGRHRTERDQLAEEVTKQMGDDEKINIGRNAEQLEHKAEMANKTKAERAASLFPRLRGPVDEYGNAAVSGGSSAVEEAPGFKEWFGKSKVTNEQGKPLQVYHGTRASELFHEYSTEGPPSNEEGEASTSGSGADPTAYMGAHFAKEPEVANKFAGGKEGWLRSRYTGGEEKPRVNPVYLNLENPKDFGHESNLRDYIYQGKGSGYAADELLNSAMQADGIENPYDGGEEVDKWLDKYDSDPKFRAEQNQWLLEQFRSGGEGDDDLLRDFSQDLAQQAQAKLKGKGYDGAVYKNQVEGGTGYIAFDPKQIKSSLSAQFEKPDVITEKATNKLGNAAVAGGAPDSTGHSYAYTKSGDLHQVMARDSEGKTVAMVTATPEENAPRTWTVRHSASAEVGKGTGEKAYLRLVDAAQKEATRSGKPITLQGDTEMSTSAKRTWQKLETDRGLPVKWKASRPSIHFSPEEEEEVGADVTEEAPDFSKFRTQTMDKPGKKSPLKKM